MGGTHFVAEIVEEDTEMETTDHEWNTKEK